MPEEKERKKRQKADVTSDLHVISFVFRLGINLIAEERLSLQELCLLWDRPSTDLFWRTLFSDAVSPKRKKRSWSWAFGKVMYNVSSYTSEHRTPFTYKNIESLYMKVLLRFTIENWHWDDLHPNTSSSLPFPPPPPLNFYIKWDTIVKECLSCRSTQKTVTVVNY